MVVEIEIASQMAEKHNLSQENGQLLEEYYLLAISQGIPGVLKILREIQNFSDRDPMRLAVGELLDQIEK